MPSLLLLCRACFVQLISHISKPHAICLSMLAQVVARRVPSLMLLYHCGRMPTRLPGLCSSRTGSTMVSAAAQHDVIVLGTGAFGSAATYHLSLAGSKVGVQQRVHPSTNCSTNPLPPTPQNIPQIRCSRSTCTRRAMLGGPALAPHGSSAWPTLRCITQKHLATQQSAESIQTGAIRTWCLLDISPTPYLKGCVRLNNGCTVGHGQQREDDM